jgi:hypothetical protein
MARGISLHVGVNNVKVGAFRARPLNGPRNDARAMSEIALARGFHPEDVRVLTSDDDTKFEKVKGEIERAADLLQSGDLFLFTFAGHGCPVRESGGPGDEPDLHDEAFVLFDRLLLDDYLRRVLWPKFKKGVRIVGVADCCHSGSILTAAPDLSFSLEEQETITTSGDVTVVSTVTRVSAVRRSVRPSERGPAEAYRRAAPELPPVEEDPAMVELKGPVPRTLSLPAAREHLEDKENKTFYSNLKIPPAQPHLDAALLSFAACEDHDTTMDGPEFGEFTKALLEVWSGGGSEGTYQTFRDAIQAKLPGQVTVLKQETPPDFIGEAPFKI